MYIFFGLFPVKNVFAREMYVPTSRLVIGPIMSINMRTYTYFIKVFPNGKTGMGARTRMPWPKIRTGLGTLRKRQERAKDKTHAIYFVSKFQCTN